MSIFNTLFSKAKEIIDGGKDVVYKKAPAPVILPKQPYQVSQGFPQLTALKNTPKQPQPVFGVPQTSLPIPAVGKTTESTAPELLESPMGGKFVIPSVLKSVAQGTARGALATEFALLDRISGTNPEVSNKLEFVPKSWLSKNILGEEPVSVKSEAIDPLTQGITWRGKNYLKVSERAANKYGFPLLVLSTALDTITGGGKKKLIQDALVGAGNVNTARKVLKNYGIGDEIIKKYNLEKRVVGIKTPEQATDFIKRLETSVNNANATKIASNMTEEDAGILREMYTKPPAEITDKMVNEYNVTQGMQLDKLPFDERKGAIQKIINEYDKRWGGVDEVLNPTVKLNRAGAMDIKTPTTKLVEQTPTPVSAQPKGMIANALDNLKNPATRQGGHIGLNKPSEYPKAKAVNDPKSYKSAEEYVKAQGEVRKLVGDTQFSRSMKEMSHIPVDKDGFITLYRGSGSSVEKGIMEPFTSMTDTKELASFYGENIQKIKIRPGDVISYGEQTQGGLGGKTGLVIQNPLDLVKYRDYYGLRNEHRTKSQLTQEWNKANQTPTLPKPKPVSVSSDNLTTEALKYKSAEEFVKKIWKEEVQKAYAPTEIINRKNVKNAILASTNKESMGVTPKAQFIKSYPDVYHGTIFGDVAKTGPSADNFYNNYGAAFFSTNKAVSKTYTDVSKRLFIPSDQAIKPSLKSYKVMLDNPKVIDWEGKVWHGTNEAIALAKKDGHDGIIIKNVIDTYDKSNVVADNIVVFNNNAIKSPSQIGKIYDEELAKLGSVTDRRTQLTDIYNKAHGKPKGILAKLADNYKNMTPAEKQGGFIGNKPKEFPNKPAKKANPFIKINAEIKDIRNALKNKDLNANKIGELTTRIDIAEDTLPDVKKLIQIGGRELNQGTDLSQVMVTAMRKRQLNPIAKSMTRTEAEKVLREQSMTLDGTKIKVHNAKTIEAARIVRRTDLDSAVTEYGFKDLEEAQKAIADLGQSKEMIADMRQELKPLKAQRALSNQVGKAVQVATTARRSYVKFLLDQFQLADSDIKNLVNGRDFRLMGDTEFSTFVNKMEQKAVQIADTRQAKMELMALLEDKNFIKVENYRKAQKLPPVSQMNKAQFNQYAKSLEEFPTGDEFLSQRTIETIDRTPLEGVRTMREVRVRLHEQLVKDPQYKDLKLDDLKDLKADSLDLVRYDTALAEKNPFYNLVVTRTQTAIMKSKADFLVVQDEINRLTKLSNKSRSQTVFGKVKHSFVPKQTGVIKYLEAPTPDAKALASKSLTKEELNLASYMEQYYRGAYDHLVKIEELKGSRYADAYFTHTKKKFLETWSDDGFIDAIHSWFAANADEAKIANIIDQDTGKILPKSKFFQYTLRRTGNIAPSENATQVFLNYAKQFERKKMFDSIIPELDVYTQALTPTNLTPKGLEMDRSLKDFVNKYLNNKKARRENFGGLIKQGGKADVTLRIGNTFVSLMDLGLNVFASAATSVGELVSTYQALGKVGMAKGLKRRIWDTGLKRMSDPNAVKILKEAEPFIGRNFWTELSEANIPATDKALTAIFAPFSQASTEANKIFLLASLTDDELKLGKISAERMAKLRLEAGRWRDMGADVKSIVGSTSLGATGVKYKGWAVPIARTNIKNLTDIAQMLKSGNLKTAVTSKQMQETYRAIESTLVIYTVGNYILSENDENTFVGKLNARIQREALTILGGIDPTMFISAPRLATFVSDLAKNLKSLILLEEYKATTATYKEGDLKAIPKLKKQFTPTAFKQFQSKTPSTGNTELDQALKSDKEQSASLSEQATLIAKEMMEVPPIEAKTRLNALIESDPILARKVVDKIKEDKLGLTGEDKAIKSLGVENGARARYIVTQLNKLDSKEAKTEYLNTLIDKKVVSDSVMKQIKEELSK
jgi:hypothetical protein